MSHLGAGRFKGYSAGSQPKSAPHPAAIELLREKNLPTTELRSKSWDVFAAPSAPHMDYIITVCDNAAGEVCPIWPGHPATAHWGLDDPAAVTRSPEAQRAAFRETYRLLELKITTFLAEYA